MAALLVALAEAPEGRDEEFNAWYDEEHSPNRMKVPGITSAERFVRVDGDVPTYFARYDLDELGVLEREPYLSIRGNRSPREQEMIDALPVLERRLYDLVDEFPSNGDPDEATHLLAVWMDFPDADELARWYREEHAPMLLEIDGWLRVRRFELREGPGPTHLAMHDLRDLSVFDDPQYQRTVSTPWRTRVAEQRLGHERGVYRLHRRF